MSVAPDPGPHPSASQAYRRFGPRLVAVARRSLSTDLRARVDPEDVVHSVFRSFLGHGRRSVTGGWDGLWGLLLVMTRRRCRRHGRDAHTARRDPKREVRCKALTPAGCGPSPPDEVAAADLLARLGDGLCDRGREVLHLHVLGFTQFEIAERLGCAVRTVRRAVADLRRRYARLVDSPTGSPADVVLPP